MDLKKITEQILKYWQEKDIEKRTLELDPDIKKIRNKDNYPLQFNFYDWPPFASWDPHYWHLLASTIKDLVPRYMYMRGYFVPRKWWWDCHWLPAEGYVEKLLKVRWKKEIENKIGIEKFIEACRFSVKQVNENWKRFVSHLGRWVDITRAYFTMDLDFMESVMWVFSTMYKNNLIYKSFKIQWYCPNCATPLSAYEISQGYADKQDKAITVKFRIRGESEKITLGKSEKKLSQSLSDFSCTDDWFIEVVAGVVKKDNKYLVLYHPMTNLWTFPGGKVEKGEWLKEALKRELKEEIWIEVDDVKYLGSFKKIIKNQGYKINYFIVNWDWNFENIDLLEPDKHSKLWWIEIVEWINNDIWFGIKVFSNDWQNLIIDDPNRIKKEFIDIYMLEYVFKKVSLESLENAPVYFLAWTTTPWTLPSNMFLAVNPEIEYVLIFDKKSREYYILAKDLLKRYYKNPKEYVEVFSVKWKDLIWLRYEPIFDYYYKAPNIPKKYKKDVFKVLPWEFVSIDSWTGIVHIAPAFGEDDWNVVVQSQIIKKESQTQNADWPSYEECKLPTESSSNLNNGNNLFKPENANEWLFLPLNEYAEYTDLVPDYKWMQVFEANEKIIDDLKKRNLVVKVESITHSYPHCRRCDTPLIYRAIDSWFVNVNKFKEKLLNEAKDIYFVPESVKNRFVKGIESAPDWNISRNRYWGAPLPVWEKVESTYRQSDIKSSQVIKNFLESLNLRYSFYDEKNWRIIVGCLDDLYKLSKTWSKNITRLVLQRHWETDYNVKHWADSLWKATLTENWWKQAEDIANEYINNFSNDLKTWDFVIVVSPLQRTFQTITPFVKKLIIDNPNQGSQTIRFEEIKNRYYKVAQLYQYLWKNYVKDLIEILKWNKSISDIDDSQVKVMIKELENSWIEMISSVIFKISSVIPLYIDFRITDHITPSIQDKPFDCHTIEFNDNPIAGDKDWESALEVYNRVVNAARYWTESNFWKTVIMVSHGDPIVMLRKALRNFDREERKYDFYPSRWEYKIHYIRKKLPNEDEVIDFVKKVFENLMEEEKQKGKNIQINFSELIKSSIKEIDLHRPYIDEIWFNIDGVKFKRITEILDCWFESGSMPYWQDHYPFKD